MKMHGLGNDFVVIDERAGSSGLSPEIVMAMADRHRGIGFDQLVVLLPASEAAAHLVFWNSDGSLSSTCGNATRCVADHLMRADGSSEITLTTERGAHLCRAAGGLVSVNMGAPLLEWHQIPLAQPMETLHLPLPGGPTATGMGNPHCTFFVEDAEAVALEELGPKYENDPLFPERTNVQFASMAGKDRLRMRVWERGAGITLASGSSSCATAVAAIRRGLTGRMVEIVLDGGSLHIDWAEDGIWMTGPTAHVFSGVWHG